MQIDPQYISFKDPDATVVKSEKGFTRYIFLRYQEQYDHLMQSGLYDALIKENLLIPHQEIDPDSDDPKIYKQLLPYQIPFQSYPYEWSFTQWRKAALAFLKINQIALKYGMILKDGTPYNFYLKGGKAILFDTSSFMFFKEQEPWLAYRQFCEVFFAPLTLMKYNGARWAKLYMSGLRGLPMKFVSKQLPLKSWLNISSLLHIHLHAKYEGRKGKSGRVNKGFSRKQLEALFDLFKSTIKSWKSAYQFPENWINYYEQDIESEEYLINKQAIITQWLDETNPKSVIDLGANTGLFSMIASKHAEQVISLEFDDTCVDKIEKEILINKIQNIDTLVGDLSETSPNLGMLNKEYSSLIVRGKSEMVMGLALIHHLCIGKNLSLSHIVELINKLSSRYVIVEFIPKEDNKVKLLLESREDIFENYSELFLISNLEKYFKIIKTYKYETSKRILFLLEKK